MLHTLKKTLALVLALTVLVGCIGTFGAGVAHAETIGFQEGTYTGTADKNIEAMQSDIHYDITVTFLEGKYDYDVKITVTGMLDYTDEESYSGNYSVSDDSLVFDGGNLKSASIISEGKLSLSGKLSSFSGAVDSAEVTLVKPEMKYADDLASGDYELTEDSYDAAAFMKMPAIITVDVEAKTFVIKDNREATRGTVKGSGTISFDEKTGVYSFTYTADVSANLINYVSKVTYADEAITFTNAMAFGGAVMNVMDDDGNFIPYTAKLVKYEDNLKSGNYELTEDSYDAAAFMKMPAIITVDAETKTFVIKDNREATRGTVKGSGTISFDEKTGVYSFTYTADVSTSLINYVSKVTYADEAITFTSAMAFGGAVMNVLDDDGNFIPYTAKLVVEEPVTYPDDLKSGNYELTEESYDSAAFMKMPAIITVDAEAKTFVIKDNREATRGTVKGSGIISFDETTGVYTFTYTADGPKPGSTSTVTYADEAITFTSPMYFGAAMMNVLDENGSFIPYTAHLMKDKEEEKPQNYTITEGADGTVTQGVAEAYRLCCDGPFDKFSALYIDGVLVEGSNYEKSEGSTVIVISADYMKTLAVGTHTIKLEYTDGSAETTLTVKTAPAEEDTKPSQPEETTPPKADDNTNPKDESAAPKTGDPFSLGIWTITACISFVAIITLLVWNKRKEIQ